MNEFLKHKMEKAVNLAQALRDEGQLVAAYIGGSIPAGLGNETSDVDLFALTHDITGDRVVQYNADGDRVDVEFYTFTEADEFLSSIEAMELAPNNLQRIGDLKEALDWFTRLRQSSDAVSSPELVALHEKADRVEIVARRIAVAHWILFADSMTEDFRGAAASREVETAIFASQEMVAYAGKALVSSLGDLYFPAKWVYQQIDRTCEKHMAVRDFRALQTGLWANTESPDFDSVVRATQTLSACATLETLVPGATRDFAPAEVVEGGPIRDSFAVPVPLTDRALLHFEMQRQVVVPPLVFAIWVLCDGRSTDDILIGVRSVLEASASSRSFEGKDLERIFQTLRTQRLIN